MVLCDPCHWSMLYVAERLCSNEEIQINWINFKYLLTRNRINSDKVADNFKVTALLR